MVVQNDERHCDHCKVDGHTTEKCWKLHHDKKPKWLKNGKKKVSNMCQ